MVVVIKDREVCMCQRIESVYAVCLFIYKRFDGKLGPNTG
jgi:hypothetical protein